MYIIRYTFVLHTGHIQNLQNNMSIVALKRKTQHQYHNVSVGQKQFSLNGTRRSQGFVGQTSLSRSLPRTLMNGNTVRGHGGNNGQYHLAHVVTDGTGLGNNCLNDNKVIKSSVLDTNGLIMTKYRWIRRPQPITSVKPDTTLNLNTQQQYIENLQRITSTQQCSTKKEMGVPDKCNTTCAITRPRYTSFDSMVRQARISKPNKVMTQSDYLSSVIVGKCGKIDAVHQTKIVNPTIGIPFACSNVRKMDPNRVLIDPTTNYPYAHPIYATWVDIF